ncbi:MAG TPA: hypothetical protein VMZ03_12300 [Chitinophagaceae bacterium]|nr:hypothetical protein [Chitinophagaceae bacterium]
MKAQGTFYGLWWLKGHQENPINGTLYLTAESGVLHTLDPFEQTPNPFHPHFPQYKEIIGIASNIEEGKDYSFKLFNVSQTRRESQVLYKNRYQSNLTLIGSVNTGDSNTEFNYLMLSSKSLNEWVKPTGIQIKEISEENDQFGIQHHYTQPERILLFRDDYMEIYFFFRIRSTTNTNEGREVTLTETPFLNIKFSNPISIEDILNYKETFDLT